MLHPLTSDPSQCPLTPPHVPSCPMRAPCPMDVPTTQASLPSAPHHHHHAVPAVLPFISHLGRTVPHTPPPQGIPDSGSSCSQSPSSARRISSVLRRTGLAGSGLTAKCARVSAATTFSSAMAKLCPMQFLPPTSLHHCGAIAFPMTISGRHHLTANCPDGHHHPIFHTTTPWPTFPMATIIPSAITTNLWPNIPMATIPFSTPSPHGQHSPCHHHSIGQYHHLMVTNLCPTFPWPPSFHCPHHHPMANIPMATIIPLAITTTLCPTFPWPPSHFPHHHPMANIPMAIIPRSTPSPHSQHSPWPPSFHWPLPPTYSPYSPWPPSYCPHHHPMANIPHGHHHSTGHYHPLMPNIPHSHHPIFHTTTPWPTFPWPPSHYPHHHPTVNIPHGHHHPIGHTTNL